MMQVNRVVAQATLILVLAATSSGQTVAESFRIRPDDTSPPSQFGRSVAIHGDVAIVGAYGHGDQGYSTGAAYLFDATSGLQTVQLFVDEILASDRFGTAVATNGSVALVGALGNDDLSNSSGCVYLFDTSTGHRLAKLYPDLSSTGSAFGFSLAVSGSTAIIGAIGDDSADPSFYQYCDSGAAYLFDTSTGLQMAKLISTDIDWRDHLGYSVAISGSIAVVGAPQDDDQGYNSGSAYLFDTSTGLQIAKLLPSDGEQYDFFGRSVAISGTTVVIGSHADDIYGEASGSAYVFDATTGLQIVKLVPDKGAAYRAFGLALAINGNTAIIATERDDEFGAMSGCLYLFDTMTGLQIEKVLASDEVKGARFGFSVASHDTRLIVGSIWHSQAGSQSGTAYLFCLTPGTNFCTVNRNSTGEAAIISAVCSSSLVENEFTLRAQPVPDQPCMFFHGSSSSETPFGDGYLCASGGLIRLGPPEVAQGNVATRPVDLPVEVGTVGTRYFQCWFRDPLAGGAGFNLSDGLSVTFVP